MSAAEPGRDFEVSDLKPDYEMPVHPVCDLFPLMDANSLAGLAADIGANGLVNAIVLHEGQIVDGRNRLLACRKAGREPRFVEWREVYTGAMAVTRWIWSVNAERRHLTMEQVVAAQVALRAVEEEDEARKRQVETLKLGPKARWNHGGDLVGQTSGQPDGEPESGRVRDKLAKEVGVSRYKVEQALAVQKADPALLKQVAHGALTLCEAEKQAKAKRAAPAPAPEKATATPTKRQRVIDAAAKRRMVEALSQLRGLCRGLSKLDVTAVRNACTAEETTTWAAIARNASKELRLFSSKLESAKEN